MGTCKYCGQSAGLFSNAHKSCIEKYKKSIPAEALQSTSPEGLRSYEWLPKSKVSLSIALKLFVDNLGIQILTDGKLPNSLSDIVDFSECKGAKSVLRELIYNNALNIIINESNLGNQTYNLQILSQKAEIDFGFNPTVVKYVLDALGFAIGIDSNNNSIVHNDDDIESPIPPSNAGNNTITSQNNHLEFWGVALGRPIHEFDKLLKTKGYGLSKYNNPDEKKILYNAYGRTEMFIGYGSGISLYESPYSSLVYKVEVYLSKMITKTEVIYNELYPLLIQKYGKPAKDDNIQGCKDKEGKGVVFNIPEGTISLIFGKYYTGDNSLYLKYEDKATIDSIANELPVWEDEIRRKKEKEEQDYRNKLISDL